MEKSHKFGCTVDFKIPSKPTLDGKEWAEIIGILPRNTNRVTNDSGGIYNGVSLTNKEKIERAIPLPEILNIYDIAELWCSDERERKIVMDAIYMAFHNGKLEGIQNERPSDCKVRFYGAFMDVEIHKSNFKTWFYNNDIALPKNCSLLNWWANDAEDSKSVGLMDARIKMILEVLNTFQVDLMNIPVEYKQKVKAQCLKIKVSSLDFNVTGLRVTDKDPNKEFLFNFSGFDDAWSEASAPKNKSRKAVISIQDKNSYIKKYV